MRRKRRYVVATVVQTNYPLEGVYKIREYTLYPCSLLVRNVGILRKSPHLPLSYFIIAVNTTIPEEDPMQLAKEWYKSIGLPEKKATFLAEHEYRMCIDPQYRSNYIAQIGIGKEFEVLYRQIDPWRNMATLIGREQIKGFVAWLSCLTRSWMKPYCESAGNYMHSIICTLSVQEFRKEGFKKLEEDTYLKIEETKKGDFIDIERPDFVGSILAGTLKLPSDSLILTAKLLSMDEAKKEKFLNACYAYAFALDRMAISPSLSIIGLVSAIDALKPKGIGSKKWFESFGEDLLNNYSGLLSEYQKKILRSLGKIYRDKRSKFVHAALCGKETYTRSLLLGALHDIVKRDFKSLDFGVELEELSKLINVYLIKWLEDNTEGGRRKE